MLGFSFGEIMVLVIVGIVVVGPRKLPELMRTAGRWIGRIRRMSVDLRAQSGIDDLIRQEGLEREIRELRSLSRVNVIETLVTPMASGGVAGSVVSASARVSAKAPDPTPEELVPPLREREYPLLGCDVYGAFADEDSPYQDESDEPPNPAAAPSATAADAAADADAAAATVTETAAATATETAAATATAAPTATDAATPAATATDVNKGGAGPAGGSEAA